MFQIKFVATYGNNHSYLVNTILRTLNPVNARKYKTMKGARIGMAKALSKTGILSSYKYVEIEQDGYGVR